MMVTSAMRDIRWTPRSAPGADDPSLANDTDRFAGQHVLSMRQYDRSDLEQLYTATDTLFSEEYDASDKPLEGKILLSAFFEKSTRTRLSHETAMLRLGGSVSGFADAQVTRAAGLTQEAHEDIYRMLSFYGDVLVTRHPDTGAPGKAAHVASIPVINAGDGLGEHPTQAMTDLYTLRQEFGRIDDLRILITHDLRMRSIRSLLLGLQHYNCEIHCLPAAGKGLDPTLVQELRAHGRLVIEHSDLIRALPAVDVVYTSPTLRDDVPRQPPTDTPSQPSSVTITRDVLEQHAGVGLVVLNELPRRGELSSDVDETPFNRYWKQAANGLPVRMALLKLMFGK